MNIVVPLKLVPDLVEELEINDDGTDIDREFLTNRVNEFDDHALEEALQLKEAHGGTVTVIAADADETDKALGTALAKGADRAIKITGLDEGFSTPVLARALTNVLAGVEFDLVLTGVQAADDREGQLPVLLASLLDVPYLSVVSNVSIEGSTVTAHKEYSGGVLARFETEPKAVLGIQAARETPRYAPVSRVRQVMRDAELEEMEAGDVTLAAASRVRRMYTRKKGAGAEMIEGDADAVAGRILEILNEKRS